MAQNNLNGHADPRTIDCEIARSPDKIPNGGNHIGKYNRKMGRYSRNVRKLVYRISGGASEAIVAITLELAK